MRFFMIGDPDGRLTSELAQAGHQVESSGPDTSYSSCAGELVRIGEPQEIQIVIWDQGAASRDLAARLNAVSPLPILICADPSTVPTDYMRGLPPNTSAADLISHASYKTAAQPGGGQVGGGPQPQQPAYQPQGQYSPAPEPAAGYAQPAQDWGQQQDPYAQQQPAYMEAPADEYGQQANPEPQPAYTPPAPIENPSGPIGGNPDTMQQSDLDSPIPDVFAEPEPGPQAGPAQLPGAPEDLLSTDFDWGSMQHQTAPPAQETAEPEFSYPSQQDVEPEVPYQPEGAYQPQQDAQSEQAYQPEAAYQPEQVYQPEAAYPPEPEFQQAPYPPPPPATPDPPSYPPEPAMQYEDQTPAPPQQTWPEPPANPQDAGGSGTWQAEPQQHPPAQPEPTYLVEAPQQQAPPPPAVPQQQQQAEPQPPYEQVPYQPPPQPQQQPDPYQPPQQPAQPQQQPAPQATPPAQPQTAYPPEPSPAPQAAPPYQPPQPEPQAPAPPQWEPPPQTPPPAQQEPPYHPQPPQPQQYPEPAPRQEPPPYLATPAAPPQAAPQQYPQPQQAPQQFHPADPAQPRQQPPDISPAAPPVQTPPSPAAVPLDPDPAYRQPEGREQQQAEKESWLEPVVDDTQFASVTADLSFGSSPWRSQVGDSGPRGTVITVASAKGGAGKSTLALWIAQAINDAGRKIALVDANVGQADLSKMLGVRDQARGIQYLLQETGGERFEDDLLLASCLKVGEIGTFMAGPLTPLDTNFTDVMRLMHLAISRLARMYEFVIVDSPVASVYEEVFNTLLLADGGRGSPLTDVLTLVINPHNTTAHDNALWVRDICTPLAQGGRGYPAAQCVAVINKADPKANLSTDSLQNALRKLGLDIVAEVPDIESVLPASNKGMWQCPAGAAEGVMAYVANVCNVAPGARQQPKEAKKRKLLGRFRSN